MEKLRFKFTVLGSTDGKTNVICITSIETPDGRIFEIPDEFKSDCELVKVVGIKYVIKPPRVACVKLARQLAPSSFTARYHDMADVIDFLVLRQQYNVAVERRWGPGDRFRCMIDDSWWAGVVVERTAPPPPEGGGGEATPAERFAREAAPHFLSLKVRWDNGEVERLSPWDLEPIDPDRLPAEPGGSVPVLGAELESVLYRCGPDEWPPGGPRERACEAIADHIAQVMTVSAAEPFLAPVDLAQYPQYAMVVPYPVDLNTIKSRFQNLFYRRACAAQFDVRYLASNAEQFNQPHSAIVRQARLVTELVLCIISEWADMDVMSRYHALAAAYHSSDDEPLHKHKGGRVPQWAGGCSRVLDELLSTPDAEPFREPVQPEHAPDYHTIIPSPMDLSTVRRKLQGGLYAAPAQFAADVRQVFSNSRRYNTNKRSRIYSMTVRLSSLFESLWARTPRRAPRTRTRRNARPVDPEPAATAMDSESSDEPLAMTSRRARGGGSDSWDSDVPLTRQKGKGVGKKSKPSTASEPSAGPNRDFEAEEEVVDDRDDDELYEAPARSPHEGGSPTSSAYTNIEVLEEELYDVDITYDSAEEHSQSAGRRKRLRSSSSDHSTHKRSYKHNRHKKRSASDGSQSASSSSSGGDGGGGGGDVEGRYESDRSYRPADESDDDAPLNVIRQRQEAESEAGPSTSTAHHNGHTKKRSRVRLRTRRSPRRYTEDSSDDSSTAISKRLSHYRRQGTTVGAPHTSDHNYFNGHAARRTLNNTNGVSPPTPAPVPRPPLSISSRGRVRTLTAKARGLLRE